MTEYTFDVILTRADGSVDTLGRVTRTADEYGADLAPAVAAEVAAQIVQAGPLLRWGGQLWPLADMRGITAQLVSMAQLAPVGAA